MRPCRDMSAAKPDTPATAARIARLFCAALLGALVAGCDACGDFWPTRGEAQACRDNAPVKPSPPPPLY